MPTKIWFDSYWAHTAILCGILLWATWNGANFYFRVRWLGLRRGVPPLT